MQYTMMKIGLIGVAVVGFSINDAYTKSTKFVPVNMLVTSVEEECKLEKKTNYGVATNTKSTDYGPCAFAEIGLMLPKFKGFHIERKSKMFVEYFSPVDGKQYSGKLHFTNVDDLPSKGENYQALASKTDTKKIRKS